MIERRPQDVVAAGYDQMAARHAEWQTHIVDDPRARYVERLLAQLPPDPEILEIGSGSGVEPTPTFARLGELVGVDISREQIDRARAAVPEGEFIRADILEATFDDASFDAVASLYVLTHIPTGALPGLLQRISAWLRPGGVFLATFSSAGAHDEFEDSWLGVPMFFSGLDPTTNEAIVEAAGMSLHRFAYRIDAGARGRGQLPLGDGSQAGLSPPIGTFLTCGP